MEGHKYVTDLRSTVFQSKVLVLISKLDYIYDTAARTISFQFPAESFIAVRSRKVLFL